MTATSGLAVPRIADPSTWPQAVFRDAELGAVLVIASAPQIADRMERWLDILGREFDPACLGYPWSSGERAMLHVALALWSPGVAGPVPFGQLLSLDRGHFRRVVMALQVRRGELSLSSAVELLTGRGRFGDEQ